MPDIRSLLPVDPDEVDRAGRRMMSAIKDSCRPGGDLPTVVADAMRAAFALGAREPELILALFVPGAEPASSERQASWSRAFASELRAAVAASGRSPNGIQGFSSDELFLVGGVGAYAFARIVNERADRLGDLTAELLPIVLTYYYPTPRAAMFAAEQALAAYDPGSSSGTS